MLARWGELSGESESIEARVNASSRRVFYALDHTKYPLREWSRWEASDIDEAQRANERERVSQSKCALPHFLRVSGMKDHANYPLREWSRWEASDMDGARQGERTGSERINRRPDTLVAQRVSCELDHTKYPRRESNPHLSFRKPPFYPLNYGDNRFWILDYGLRIG